LNPNMDSDCLPDIGGQGKYLISNNEISDRDPEMDQTEYSLSASRGCPFNCSYCCSSAIKRLYRSSKGFYALRSVENVMKELGFAKASYQKIEFVRFWDDIFPHDSEWIREFCSAYKENIKLPFIIWGHPLLVKKENFTNLVDAGLQMIVMGIQHGSPRIRNTIYKRPESNEDILRASRILRETGVSKVYYDLILDSPFETVEDLKATYDLCMKLYKPFTLQFHSLDILPGSAIEQMTLDQGLMTVEKLEALRSRSMEEKFGSFLWHHVSDEDGKPNELAFWKKKIHESQLELSPQEPRKQEKAVDYEAALKEREECVKQLDAAIEERDQSIRRLESELKEKADCIRQIQSSHAWRFFNSYYVLRDRLLPVGTRRRSLMQSLLRAFFS
jgi:anaerobic magnesium-protoporphyrin IX monomethyl ester cyclase